ncbi:TetR/AcrR family transcriptional regulator [Amycolatopsis aidingensis]|uniref:TetR/AcrR family transcriptional regulator n=1 Tax=Amycolatopsis aidingensis TaxID=2842453 RepID=UPI001C0AF7BD|nr:TetR family transcriptional regulator [Amycolatopsis aidingensis]
MSPRRSAVEAKLTYTTIVTRATEIASEEGLEGVTIGRLAADLRMSKSGVLGHFGAKESLQLAALRHALRMFERQVVDRAGHERAGLPRLLALCEAWIEFLATVDLPGGCVLTAASTEFDGRPGPVRDAVAEAWAGWRQTLGAEVTRAVADGDLPGSEVEQVVFELVAIGPAVNQALQLHGDRAAVRHARRAVRRVLGLTE